MWRFSLAVLTATALVGSAVGAQTNYSQVLIGKWEGQMRYESARANPSRTLIIESGSEGDGALAVLGRYGITGRNLERMRGTLETSGSRPRLRFMTGANSNVVLELQGDNDLIGTIQPAGAGERDVRPKKVE